MQLLPGQALVNPNLNSSNQATIRLAADDPNNEKVNSFGTAVVMDGAPISNNANLQVTNTSKLGAEGYFETSSGGGVDLREIPTDNIESVEVIRGIPSVRHGDLTSGAIIVNTKAGKTPFTGKIRSNPTTNQFYLGKGFNLGKKNGNINVDVDFANSQADIRKAFPNYNRYTADVSYSNYFFDNAWSSNSKISGSFTNDQNVNDKDAALEERRYSKDKGLRFTSNGKIRFKNKLSDCIQYSLSATYKEQESYTKSLQSGGLTMLSTAMEEGIYEVPFIPSEYYSETTIYGKPLNLFASLESTKRFKIGEMENKVALGLNWKTDANYGIGRVISFDETIGLYPNSSARPRNYSDIPALNQLSFYLEDEAHLSVFGKMLKIQMGLRFDNIQPTGLTQGEFGTTLLPRINMEYAPFKNFNFRMGYGLSSKSPSLIFLYPDKAYFDAQTYQYYDPNYPSLSRAFISTRIYEADNSSIRSAINRKLEFSINYKLKGNSMNLTYYSEKLSGGFAFVDQFVAFEYTKYNLLYFNGAAGIHLVDTINTSTAIRRDVYKKPVNTRNISTQGIEYAFQSVKIASTGTSFNLSGAWFQSITSDEENAVYINSQYFQGNNLAYIGLYPKNGVKRERHTATLRVIQHIPKISLIASLSLQATFADKSKTIVNNEKPVGFFTISGEYMEISAEELENGDYDFLIREFDDAFYLEVDRPTLFLFSFKLSKEFRKDFMISFYANNALMHNPSYYNRNSGQIEELNPSLFFGAELNFKFKL